MGWTWYQKSIALLMVITGSLNTLAAKWADQTESVGKDGGKARKFDHPFLQACAMFLGEFLCLIAFKILFCIYSRRENSQLPKTLEGNQDFSPIIFYAPALCDMVGTSVMYIGLNLTYASSFQMLRGSVIIFTGLFSVAFLHRELKLYEWLGMLIVIVGLVCVGVADFVHPDTSQVHDTNSIITGDLLIVMAQIVVATQMVVEEKFITRHSVNPLQGVGWEGLFGLVTLSLLLIPMYFIKLGREGRLIFHGGEGRLEDAIDGFVQMGNSWEVSVGITGTILSIAFFNFAGLSVTKELSATTRMVLDSVRTFIIWVFSLAVGWQHFSWLQLLGFFILLIGMCLYNDVIIRPLFLKYYQQPADSERTPFLKKDEEQSPGPVCSKSGSINQ